MSRKPKKGFRPRPVRRRRQRLDELRAEQTGGEPSKHRAEERKRRAAELGEALLTLRADLFERLDLPEELRRAGRAQAHHQFRGRRRQMQYMGKLMRSWTPRRCSRRDALEDSAGSARSDAGAARGREVARRADRSDDALQRAGAAHPDNRFAAAAQRSRAGAQGRRADARTKLARDRRRATAGPTARSSRSCATPWSSNHELNTTPCASASSRSATAPPAASTRTRACRRSRTGWRGRCATRSP